MCLPTPIKEEIKKKIDLRNYNALVALQLMSKFLMTKEKNNTIFSHCPQY